jgi:Ca-activated chloride channel family protein
MKISAQLTHTRVRHDQDNDAHLVVTIAAPTSNTHVTRPRICVVPIIDVSPSMIGEKIAYAQRSVLKLIDHLSDGDYCGLVQFSGRAEVLSKPILVNALTKDELKRKVGDITIGSATNIADALLTGLKLANDMDLPPEIITRVILFTDGSANTGPAITDKDLLALLDKNIGLATVSAFGYGLDAKQDLLGEMAKRGKANYAFIQHPDAALSAFGRELGGLLSTYAMDLTIEVQPLASNRVSGVVSDVDADEADASGAVTVKIPDLLVEETRHIVVGVKLPKQKTAFPRPVNAFDVKVMYDVLGVNGGKERKTEDLKIKVQFVKPGEEQDKADAALDAIVGLAQVVRAQIEAENRAKKGDYAGAQQWMHQTAVAMNGRGQTPLGNLAANIGQKMASSHLYAANAGYLRSTHSGGTRGVGVASYDAAAEADLHLNGVVTTTSCTAHLADEFQQAAREVTPGIGGRPLSPFNPLNPIQIGSPGDFGDVPLDWASGGSVVAGDWSRRAVNLGYVQPSSTFVPSISTGTSIQGISLDAVVIGTPSESAEAPLKGSKKTATKVTQKKSTRW